MSELLVYPRLVFRVFPGVRRELVTWRRRACDIPDVELRKQALDSISSKAFHCMGGSVMALDDPIRLRSLTRAIVAIQTVSDYLDNLCDRATTATRWAGDPSIEAAREGFSACVRLHEAFLCAVDPGRPPKPYYGLYPVEHASKDGGYLAALVDSSRNVEAGLPSYRVVLPWINKLAHLYCELQSIKHLSPGIRDGLMEEWFRVRWTGDLKAADSRLPLDVVDPGDTRNWAPFPLEWWEFAAATGSTLGIFALMCASGDPSLALGQAHDIYRAYFPSISGLHILLDYYIDQDEDRAGGDLNFVRCYPSSRKRQAALSRFAGWAMAEATRLPRSWLHRAVVRGLLAMYLSDPKVDETGLHEEAQILVREGGPLAQALRVSCGVTRKVLGF